ncbi:Ig-like domain-containing protein [Mycolicibacterium fluoranthenivorans]|uniref:Ig-like domain-containing protein n=1 Tax=Mycolicibacterium fluoranthenivorans TaxID=258505 RepID=UPI00147FABCD|nr:Ig-like domain-containing protein [Mycolicibacterium fluoranthenivorans]
MSAPATATEAPEQVSTPVQPKEQKDLAVAVLSAVTDPFNSSGGPGVPVESPTVWVALAAARREVETLLTGAKPEDSGTPLSTAQAATAVNAPPVVGAPTYSAADPTTGAVTGKVVATDPEGKKLSYTVVAPPAEGKLVLDNKTGAFTFTPTAAQRLIAGLGGAGVVEFGVTVSDGVKANNQVATLRVTIAPTPITDAGVLATGKNVTGVVATDSRAYLTNYDDKTITVVDTINRAVLGTIELEAEPISAVLAPDGKKLYVSLDYTDHVAVIDTTTGAVASTFDLKERYPVSVAVSPNGKTLYVTTLTYDKNGNQVASVAKVSTASGKVTGTVKLPGAVPTFYDIEVAADGKKVYVIADMPTDDPDVVLSGLYVFSSSSSGAKVIATGTYFTDVELSPDGTRAYLNEVSDGTISGIDTKTYKVVGTIDTYAETLGGLTINGDGSVLLAVDTVNNTVVAIDTRTAAVLTTTPVTATTTDFYPRAVLSPDGTELYYYGDDDQLQIISLVPHNDFPVAHAPVVNAPGTNGVVTGHLTVTDSNGDPLTFSAVPARGSIVFNADGSFTYTPTAAARHAAATGLAGTTSETFLVTISDGRRGVLTQDLTVDIAPLNIDPTGKAKTGKPSSSGVVKGTVTGSDKDKDVLTYTASDPAKGDVTIDAKGRFVFTPTDAARHAASAVGATEADKNETFTVTVNDGHGGTFDVPVTVKISPRNVAPDQVTVTSSVVKQSTGRLAGSIVAVDPEGDSLTVTGPVSTKKGAIVLNPDGTFTYTPTTAARTAASAPKASAAAKTDSFVATIADGHGGTKTVKVTVNIMPATAGNHLPIAGKPTSENTVDTSTGVVSGKIKVTDSDGNTLKYLVDNGIDPVDGTLSLNQTTGVFTFTPSNQARFHAWFTDGDDAVKFTVEVSDGVDASYVDIVAPVLGTHPDQDGSLTVAELRDLVETGDVEIAQNDFGGISAIDGRFTSAIVTDAEDAAAVLNAIAEHLSAESGFALVANITVQTNGVEKFYRASQTVDGIPVLGSNLILATDAAGKVTGVFSGYNPQLESVVTTPSSAVDQPAEVEAKVKAALMAGFPPSADPAAIADFLSTLTYDSDLVIYNLKSDIPPSLAWRVQISTELPPLGGDPTPLTAAVATYYVYANGSSAGSVLAEVFPFDAASVSQSAYGYKFLADSRTGGPVLIDLKRDITTNRIVYQWNFLGARWGGYDAELVKKGSSWAKDAVAAHTNMALVYDYYQRVLSRDSYDGHGAPIVVNVDFDEGDDAWWSSVAKQFVFAGGGHQYAEDVVGHEFTHAVIQYIVGAGGQVWSDAESGALGEAYGDIIGSLIEGKPRASDERWLVAEDSDAVDGRIAMRSMEDPSAFEWGRSGIKYSHDVDTRYLGTRDDFGEHINSTIFSHAAYRMIMDPQEGSVRGWGRTSTITDDQWGKVFYGSLFRLGTGATFVDARSAVISSAKAQGFSRQQIEAIQDAFDHVGIRATNYGLGAYDTVNLCSSSCEPKDLAASASGNRVFVLVGNTVKVVETNPASGTPTVDTVSVGGNPTSLAVSSDGSRAYVVNAGSGTVSIVERLFGVGATTTVTTVTVGNAPNGIGVSADGTRAYVANSGSGTVSIVDYSYAGGTATPSVRTVTLGGQPTKVAVSADGTRAYVTNAATGTVSLITYRGGTPTVETITVGSGPREVAVSADGGRALVYAAGGSVYVIKSDPGAAATSIRVPGTYYSYTDYSYTDGFIALSADGTRGYVTDHNSKFVAIIDLTTATPGVWSVYLTDDLSNDYPHSVATTTTGSRGFVVTHNKLYVVDARTHEYYTANIPLGINNNASDFQQVAVSANGAFVMATDINGTLTILNATAF